MLMRFFFNHASKVFLICLLLFVACVPQNQPESINIATISALEIEATQVSQQATQIALDLRATSLAQQAEQLTLAQPTPPFLPTPTSAPTVAPSPAPIDEQQFSSARILLFEDISGNSLGLYRYVKNALDSSGYTYTDVGSAQGWFKSQLNSTDEWDLIIAAAEASGRIQGEYFDYLVQRLEQGSAVILEVWDLDDLTQGKVRNLLDLCGIKVFGDWYDPPSRAVWFLQPEHPVFTTPNLIAPSLRNAAPLWIDDIGDLLQIKTVNAQPVGDALLLAGTIVTDKTSHGTLATCLQGRLIIQTFRSHEYDQKLMTMLWQNYIYQTLYQRLKYQNP